MTETICSRCKQVIVKCAYTLRILEVREVADFKLCEACVNRIIWLFQEKVPEDAEIEKLPSGLEHELELRTDECEILRREIAQLHAQLQGKRA